MTKRNIQNGFEVLNEIQAVLDSGEKNQEARLLDLTNKFFTIIPQDFGEERPQPIGMLLLSRLGMRGMRRCHAGLEFLA